MMIATNLVVSHQKNKNNKKSKFYEAFFSLAYYLVVLPAGTGTSFIYLSYYLLTSQALDYCTERIQAQQLICE